MKSTPRTFKPLLRGTTLVLAFVAVGQAAAQTPPEGPPPSPPPTPTTLPTTTAQCLNGGWQTYKKVFRNQGDCVSFVATERKNPPAGSPPPPPPAK